METEKSINPNSGYIMELHKYLWGFVRCELPDASGELANHLDMALEKAKQRSLPDLNESNNALSIDTSKFGVCRGSRCPVCDKISREVGDLRNPCVDVEGEKMCDDCKIKLQALIVLLPSLLR